MNRLFSCLPLALAAALTMTGAAAQERSSIPDPNETYGYLYLPGINGEAAYPFTRWHKVDSFGLQVRQSVRDGKKYGTYASPLAVGADLGVALPQLTTMCATGQSFKYVYLRMYRGNSTQYFVEFRLYDALIRSVRSADAAADQASGQTVEFEYSRMYMTQVDPKTGARNSLSIDPARTPFATSGSVAAPGSTDNDYQVLVRVDGMVGSSSRSGYQGWFEFDSLGLGVRRSGTRAYFDPLSLRSKLASLPQFTMAALNGKAIPKVEVHVFSKRVSRGPVLTVKLQAVYVTNVMATEGTAQAGQLLNFDYGRIEFEYFKGGKGSGQGSTVGGFDRRSNTQV